MFKYLPLILLCSCKMFTVTEPDWENGGKGSWRFGVSQDKPVMTPEQLKQVPRMDNLSDDKMLEYCGAPTWGCYKLGIIFLSWRAGSVERYHEEAHAFFGHTDPETAHNDCYGKGYAMFGENIDEACRWDK